MRVLTLAVLTAAASLIYWDDVVSPNGQNLGGKAVTSICAIGLVPAVLPVCDTPPGNTGTKDAGPDTGGTPNRSQVPVLGSDDRDGPEADKDVAPAAVPNAPPKKKIMIIRRSRLRTV